MELVVKRLAPAFTIDPGFLDAGCFTAGLSLEDSSVLITSDLLIFVDATFSLPCGVSVDVSVFAVGSFEPAGGITFGPSSLCLDFSAACFPATSRCSLLCKEDASAS